MAKTAIKELNEKKWNPQADYEKVNHTIMEEWPDWKKKAYNEMFAVSAHAKKIRIHQ